MAFRCARLLCIVRNTNYCIYRHGFKTSQIVVMREVETPKQFKTEDNFVYLEDPDTFGTLLNRRQTHSDHLQDEDDIKEHKFIEDVPLRSQQLTIRQYADIIKQYLKHKRLKEAIDTLEVRMLTEDRVKPDNYIYNILIGACAEVGYTKKAFKLYNDMKRRGLKATGDTYTCLFHACSKSPWPLDGLKKSHNLRDLMIEKQVEPNLTNYNAMIKAFGQCGDVVTAFRIVDEMKSKKIQIRVNTFNHILHACISDKEHGLRHAIIIWRKMLRSKERPNIFSFNLMLKCVKDCNLGTKQDIEELLSKIQEQFLLEEKRNMKLQRKSEMNQENIKQLEGSELQNSKGVHTNIELNEVKIESSKENNSNNFNEMSVIDSQNAVHLVANIQQIKIDDRTVPNLLSKVLKIDKVLSLQEVNTVQDKFAVIGGPDDFLREMDYYKIKPDIKIFSQMLPLLPETQEAENKLVETMKSYEIFADIDFYNMLIKRRCLRSDYDGAFHVKQMIEEESKKRKKKYALKKKLRLNMNIMTYGVLAMACQTKEQAENLLADLKTNQLKVNIEILGTLLRHGTAHNDFDYVEYIMDIVKQEAVPPNDIFLKHLEAFSNKCAKFTKKDESGKYKCTSKFVKAYKGFLCLYENWLKEIDIKDALKPEHPWAQFRESHPETVQRQNFQIIEPKKFYKRSRKFVKYIP